MACGIFGRCSDNDGNDVVAEWCTEGAAFAVACSLLYQRGVHRLMSMKKVAGLILAAGKSERMGLPKALLPFQKSCFLAHIFKEATHSELTCVKVVLGARIGRDS